MAWRPSEQTPNHPLPPEYPGCYAEAAPLPHISSCVPQYYNLDISFFKSSTDAHMLDLLWNKYWVSTLSASPLVSNREFTAGQVGVDRRGRIWCYLQAVGLLSSRQGLSMVSGFEFAAGQGNAPWNAASHDRSTHVMNMYMSCIIYVSYCNIIIYMHMEVEDLEDLVAQYPWPSPCAHNAVWCPLPF